MDNQTPTRPAAAPGMADILRALCLTGGIFLEARLTAPWCLTTSVKPDQFNLTVRPNSRLIAFHYVVSGRLVGGLPGEAAVDLRAGDIILLPRNDLHVLGSSTGLKPAATADLPPPTSSGGLVQFSHGGGGEETRLICGFVTADAGFDALFAALPPVLTLNLPQTPGGAWMAESFAFAARDAMTAAVDITKLAELMLAQVLRQHLETGAAAAVGWLAGARDPAVGKALSLMHSQPCHGWSTEELARAVNMSRSSFADHFSKLVGTPPLRHLTDWRMQLARRALRDTSKTIGQIAYDVGYEAEAAFTRAFRREVGQPPSAWRRQAAASAAA